MKKKLLVGLILTSMLSFCACSEEGLSVEIAETDSHTVVQGADYFGTLSVGETGALRIKDNHLLFFDYESKKDYVICSRANCRHRDETCSGWFGGYHGAKGLAEYGGKLYCFINNEEENVCELVQMNLDGTQRKVIAQINRGDGAPGKWDLIFSPSDFYYTDNKAITTLNWRYNPVDDSEEEVQTEQCIAIDLKSGKITEFTDRTKDSVQCVIDAISKDYCVVDLSGYEEPMLTEKDFYQKFEQGNFDETAEIKKAENPYEAYCSWYFDEVPRWYKYILLDLKNDKVSVLKEGTLEAVKNSDGEVHAFFPPFFVCGLYEDNVIVKELAEALIEDEGVMGTVKNKIYKWNPKEGRKELLLDLDNGYVFDAGGINASLIVDDDMLLFLKRKPEGKADYYSYNLKTGEEEFLYEEVRNVPYRIIGEAGNSFVYYTYDDTKKSMYMMKKADYYEGNFEDSVRLKGLDEYF